MKSAARDRILRRLETHNVCSDDWPLLNCHKRTLQRQLESLHQEGRILIISWRTTEEPGPYLPTYTLSPGRDRPYPRRPTSSEKARRRWPVEGVAERSAALQRARRRRAAPLDTTLAGMLLGKLKGAKPTTQEIDMNINCTGCGRLIADILVRPALCEECQEAQRYASSEDDEEPEVLDEEALLHGQGCSHTPGRA